MMQVRNHKELQYNALESVTYNHNTSIHDAMCGRNTTIVWFIVVFTETGECR